MVAASGIIVNDIPHYVRALPNLPPRLKKNKQDASKNGEKPFFQHIFHKNWNPTTFHCPFLAHLSLSKWSVFHAICHRGFSLNPNINWVFFSQCIENFSI